MPTPRFVCVYVPLDCQLTVKKEEEVNAYQKLGVYNNVYYFSPCSGYILDCLPETDERGNKVKAVIIQNDGHNQGNLMPPVENINDVRQRIFDAGLNEVFNGESFTLCATDDDYYINNDNALIYSHKDMLLRALELLKSFAEVNTSSKYLSKVLDVPYTDVGHKNISVADLYNLCLACDEGIPYIYKVITVSGESVKEPAVLRVAIGTEYGDMLDFCGGEVYPLTEFNKLYTSANEAYGNVLDLKDEYKNAVEPEKTHIREELISIRKKSYALITEFLKAEKKYKKVLLDGLVYGDYATGVASEDFNNVVTYSAIGVLLLNKKQNDKRKKRLKQSQGS